MLSAAVIISTGTSPIHAQDLAVQNGKGVRLVVVEDSPSPRLRIVLPGHELSDRAIEVLFPEHVTGVRRGAATAEHLYLPRAGVVEEPPAWRRHGRSVQYERDLPGPVHLLARATLEDDGVRFRYEFSNGSGVPYDMMTAVTDPRLTSIFHDVRLERTFVHHVGGFDLLASEVPQRLTMALDRWLPARCLSSFTWPIATQRVERRDDGITYYNKSRAVDEPFIATLSTDSGWVVASFTRTTGNVWSNPELTCQHVDPQAPLAPAGHAVLEVKMLVLRASLEETLRRARSQRRSLK